MTTATAVPLTRDELEGDEALETLRETGRRRLVIDSIDRFRAADAFSHSRALAFQLTLTLLPALIAVVGLAAALEVESFTRAVRGAVDILAPGAAGDLLTAALQQGSRGAREESGELALSAGFAAALVAGMGAMSQVERGANRLYGVERDRPFVRKYLVATGLALTAGVLALSSIVVLVAGSAVSDALGAGEGFDEVWSIARWPLGLVFVVGSVALLFEYAPKRQQPEPSWLAFGAAVAAGLWIAFMGLLALYVDATANFGATYGPLAGTIGVLLWSFLSSVALFGGLAVAAQLEAVRAGVTATRVDRDENLSS
ncbi:MAG: YihY/virulence factor BrkB family protein [Actinomycetota bacterium]|nr:YihY/virulence factor BrkB family protein [Actinomycetota bacterium]